MASSSSARSSIVVVALLVTWLVWGSSFVAISYALESIPPLLLMATRFVCAGTIATVIGLVLGRRAGRPLPCRRAWRDASMIGLGFIAIGMGATGWAATRLPTGIAALLVASAPLWIALMQLVGARGRARSGLALVGIAVGMAGVGVLVAPGGDAGGGSIDLTAALVVVVANAAWAAASLFAPRAVEPGGLVLGVGMQMLTGGLVLGAFALATGEGARFDIAELTTRAAGGWSYLVVAASLGGFLAYSWLLANVSAGTASTHAFVNPLVAVGLGSLLLGEQVGSRMVIAGAAVVVAVVLLLVGEARANAPITDVAPDVAVLPHPEPVPARRPAAPSRAPSRTRVTRPSPSGRWGSRGGWSPSPAPTPSFARRTARPWQATDGMDALDIDQAFDGLG